MAQAVSDLSASNAPSLRLWNQLSSLYNVCTLVCAMMVCVGIQGKKTRLLRIGIYLFTIMEWVSAVGFCMFPLSDSGYAGTFQDKMHIFSTVIVVLLSIVSLGLKEKQEIKTETGVVLSWKYLCWVREHPVKSICKETNILYGTQDEIIPYKIVKRFSEENNCRLNFVENGQYWLHTDREVAVMRKWEQTVSETEVAKK